MPHRPYFWGIWQFAQNKTAAKDLVRHLMQRENLEIIAEGASGYDIPPFPSMSDFKIWSEVEPPAGTVFNFPLRPWHGGEYFISGSSAPPDIAVQMWNRAVVPGMVARVLAGKTSPQTIAWAKDELEGFLS